MNQPSHRFITFHILQEICDMRVVTTGTDKSEVSICTHDFNQPDQFIGSEVCSHAKCPVWRKLKEYKQ